MTIMSKKSEPSSGAALAKAPCVVIVVNFQESTTKLTQTVSFFLFKKPGY